VRRGKGGEGKGGERRRIRRGELLYSNAANNNLTPRLFSFFTTSNSATPNITSPPKYIFYFKRILFEWFVWWCGKEKERERWKEEGEGEEWILLFWDDNTYVILHPIISSKNTIRFFSKCNNILLTI
jgi:hypothetical protein